MNNQLTSQDIESIVQSGEGYNAEFKVRLPNKLKEISEEICAFANSAGGILLIGVNDDNEVIGVDIPNGKRSAIQNSLNEITPKLLTQMYEVEVQGKKVWVIEVNSGTQKPYVLSGSIYVRQGPNSQKLTTVEEMRDFFQQSSRIYFDEAPCPAFDIDNDMDELFFDEFRIEAGLSKAVSASQIINNLRLTLPDGTMKNGGVLFFGKAPEQFIDIAVIRTTEFEGTNKTQIIDDKIFGGPLIDQYHQAMQWLKKKLNVRYEISGPGPRTEHWEIPEIAFKEAIINALSHRDYYDKGAKISIELFEDRVEISNPGGLTSAISTEEFGTKSHSRNPLVFGLFVRMDMVEQVGSGVGRIQDALKAKKLPQATFKTDGIFTVVFKRTITKSSGKSSGISSRDHIIQLIKANPLITRVELSKLTGVTTKGVDYHLTKMQKEGVLKRKGSRKTGSWILLP